MLPCFIDKYTETLERLNGVEHQEVWPLRFQSLWTSHDTISLKSRPNCATSPPQTSQSPRSSSTHSRAHACMHAHTHRHTCPHTRTCREAHPLPACSRPFPRLRGANCITGNRSVSLTSPGASPVQGSRQNTCGRAAGRCPPQLEGRQVLGHVRLVRVRASPEGQHRPSSQCWPRCRSAHWGAPLQGTGYGRQCFLVCTVGRRSAP